MSPEAREHSFDELTRGMASGSISRGKALKLMGAALLGGTLASLGIGEAAADRPGCKRNGKHCKRDNQCCSGDCSSSGTCVGGFGTGDCRARVGEPCTNNSDCCSGDCEVHASEPTCIGCDPVGTPCLNNSACCSGFCDDPGFGSCMDPCQDC